MDNKCTFCNGSGKIETVEKIEVRDNNGKIIRYDDNIVFVVCIVCDGRGRF
jgi:Tfp pilus assembly protein PilP